MLTHLSGVKFYVLDNGFVKHRSGPKVSRNTGGRRWETDRNQVLFCKFALAKLLKAHKKNFRALVDMANYCQEKYHVNSWKLSKEVN